MPSPVHALVGEDSFLQGQVLTELLSSLGKGVQRIDLEGEKATLADVLDELRSYAMFGGEKLVIVRDADEFVSRYRGQLEDYVQAPSPSGTLILRLSSLPANQRIHKLIVKHGRIHPCVPPAVRELPGWVTRRAKSAHDLTLDAEAAGLIVESLGADLGRIDTELAKLALQADGKKLTARDVAATLTFQREQAIWEMTNALSAGRIDQAIRRWRSLLETDPSAAFRAVTWLGIWLENVQKAQAMLKSGTPPAAIAQQLRIWPREAQQPFFETVGRLGERGLAEAIDLLTTIDLQTKTGIGDAEENVERFLVSLAPATGGVRP